MMTSHWKIYRVVYPEKVSKDDSYLIVAINDSQVPEKYQEYQEEDFSEDFSDFTESELIAWGRKKETQKADNDLPIDLSDDPELQMEQDFYSRNFDAQQFKEDFKNWGITAGINPFSYNQQRNFSKSTSTNYTLGIRNQGKKYRSSLLLNQNRNSSEQPSWIDPTQTEKTEFSQERVEFSFNIENIVPRLAIESNINYNKASSQGFTNNTELNVAPIGLSYSAIKFDPLDEYSEDIWRLSLFPGYRKQVTFIPQGSWDPMTGIQTITGVQSLPLTTMELRLQSTLNLYIGNLSINNRTGWAPNVDPKNPTSFNTRNVVVTNNLQIAYPFSANLSISFDYDYNYNFLRENPEALGGMGGFDDFDDMGPGGFDNPANSRTRHVYSVNIVYNYTFL
jgi:hypothetical protein